MTKHQRYNASEKGKARYQRYTASEKGRAASKRYKATENGRAVQLRSYHRIGWKTRRLRDLEAQRIQITAQLEELRA